MPRPFNYTGRELVNRSDVLVRLAKNDASNWSIDVRIDLSSYRFIEQSNINVFLEAYVGITGERKRFPIKNPWDRAAIERFDLDDIQEPERLLFNLKIVENQGDGRLLGACRQIHWVGFEDEIDNASGLLPVHQRDIGQLLWSLEFPPDGSPVLLWSKKLFHRRKELSASPSFRAAVLPEILRRVLEKALVHDDWTPHGTTNAEWFSDWIDWIKEHPSIASMIDYLDDQDEDEDKQRWIADVVERFAEEPRYRFVDRLHELLAREGS